MKLLDYRSEAINRINNCENKEDFSTNNKCGFYWDEEKQERKFKACFCEICESFIDLFEIGYEELQGFAKNKDEVKEK